MKKNIYFKEKWIDTAKTFKYELFWKKHRWMPFKKMKGTFDTHEKTAVFKSFEPEYNVFIWDYIFSQYVPLKCII